MSQNIIEIDSKKNTKKKIICEKIGFFVFDIAVKINNISKHCLFKSGAKDRLKKAMEELDKKEDIGEKIIQYDSGIADVISEPIKKVNEAQSEVFNCFNFVSELHEAWLNNDNNKMRKLFIEKGFSDRLEDKK
jgi:hypothetical protein